MTHGVDIFISTANAAHCKTIKNGMSFLQCAQGGNIILGNPQLKIQAAVVESFENGIATGWVSAQNVK